MKLFKRIYYPALAVIMVVLMVLSFVDVSTGTASKRFSEEFYTRADTHIDQLLSYERSSKNLPQLEDAGEYIYNSLTTSRQDEEGFPPPAFVANGQNIADKGIESDGQDEDYDYVDFVTNGNDLSPSVVYQRTILTRDTVRIADGSGATVSDASLRPVNNVIAVIPGAKSVAASLDSTISYGDAILITVPYDSIGPGASGASAVAAGIENVLDIVEKRQGGKTYYNDIVFVFTDASKEGGLGAYAFMNQFKGYQDVASRVKVAFSFDAFGNSGPLAVVGSDKDNSKLLAEYSKLNGGTFNNSVAKDLFKDRSTDFAALGGVPSLSFALTGNGYAYNSQQDEKEFLSGSAVTEYADMMYKLYDNFGDKDNLGAFSGGSASSVFQYALMGTGFYSSVASYVLGGLILLMAAVTIFFAVKKQSFNLKKAGAGLISQILTIIATVAAGFIFYFLIALLLVAFGVMPMQGIVGIRYMNVGLFLFMGVLATAVGAAVTLILKKTFNIKGVDVVRGNAYLWAILGAIMCFAAPAYSFIVSIGAILSMGIMILTCIFKNMFKNKTGTSIETLYPYALAGLAVIPIVIPTLFFMSAAISAVMLPLFAVAVIMMMGFIVPYANLLTPVLDKQFKKLPPRTVRIERTVTEMREDKAKRGKFQEVTEKRVDREKVERRYTDRFGILVVLIVSVIAIILTSSFGTGFNKNMYKDIDFDNSVYDGALVYNHADSVLEVKDVVAYKYISRHLRGMKWNNEKEAYTISKSLSGVSNPTISSEDITGGKRFTISIYNSSFSEVKLTLKNTADLTTVRFIPSDTRYEIYSGHQYLEYENTDALNELTFRFPYGYGSVVMEAEYDGDTLPNVSADIEQHVYGDSNAIGMKEFQDLQTAFAGELDVVNYLKSNIVIKYSSSL